MISFLIPASQVSPLLLCKWFPLRSTGWPGFGVGVSTDFTPFSPDCPLYTSLPILSVLLRGRTGNWMFVLGHSPASLSDSLPSSEIRESRLCESVLPLVMDFLVSFRSCRIKIRREMSTCRTTHPMCESLL